MEVEIVVLYLGVGVTLVIGLLNWYDRRFPSTRQTPAGDSDTFVKQSQAIKLANDRAFEAEKRVDHLEAMYDQLKKEYETWIDKQDYKLTFTVHLGKNPSIESTAIYHDRREADLPHKGIDRRAK